MNQEPKDDSEMPDGSTSIRMGAAFLRPMEEAGNYGLYRSIVIVRRDGEKITRERLNETLGPLAVYRRRRNGDKVPERIGELPVLIRTSDPQTKEEFELVLIWRPDVGGTSV